jgi:NAD(P)-dependent dehydrogenase (short-subunit alcohol dehydrogenase family)
MLSLFAQPFKTLHLPPPNSFASQTVIITGANTGLGLETARHITSLGASKVILGVRTLSKGLSAKADIEKTTGRTGFIEVWELDLSRFSSVKAFAICAQSLPRLDTAIMNAGLASGQWVTSPEGWEMQLQVNVLSTSLLSLLLLPLLIRTRKTFPESKPHLVILGSDIHMQAKFEERKEENILKALNDKQRWEKSTAGITERYSVSKLFDFYITSELTNLIPSIAGEPAVIVNVVAPGFCKSELMSREEGMPWALKVMQAITARTTEEGSKTIVDAAARGKESNGKYFDHQKITKYVLVR